MIWAFRILATLNLLLIALAFFYQSPGEDAAGAGLRLGLAVVYAFIFVGVMLLYRFVSSPSVRVPVLAVLTLPMISILYGILLSL